MAKFGASATKCLDGSAQLAFVITVVVERRVGIVLGVLVSGAVVHILGRGDPLSLRTIW